MGQTEIARFAKQSHVRVITPGADAGELLHVLSSLERRSPRWDTDVDGARAALSAAVSLILRLLGRDADPARSREHVLMSVLAERRLLAGEPADIGSLLPEIAEPPVDSIGALPVNAFMSKRARNDLAAALNTLLAAPTFASWRKGATLDVGSWMTPVDRRTPATILSVAHLDDDERALVLGVVLEESKKSCMRCVTPVLSLRLEGPHSSRRDEEGRRMGWARARLETKRALAARLQ